jgi:hypothetical protein
MAQIGNTKEFTGSDGLVDVFNINTTSKRLELPNGATIQFYSDAYATAGTQITGGGIATPASATSPDPGANGTINTAGVGRALVTPAAARAGIILQAGTIDGQEVWVVNQGAAANTLTFNTTPATANVASSATETAIAGLTARKFVWVAGVALWYSARD